MQPILSLGASSIGAADMVRLRHTVHLAAQGLPFALEWRSDALAETAAVLFLDVDTMYGHVDWLRSQASGRAVIALTSRPNGSHDHELARDAVPSALEALLRQFESLVHADASTSSTASESASASASATATSTSAYAPTAELPVVKAPGRLAATREMPVLETKVAPALDPAPAEPPPPPRESMLLHDWLRDADGVRGVVAMKVDGGELVVDAARFLYYGPAMLKPLLALSQHPIARSDWKHVDPATLAQRTRNSEAMPLARLRLLSGLGAFEGVLSSALDPSLQFRLPKWPQIEREFPRHMRIATALMKGPATVDELVSQTGFPYSEVADFLNGFVAAGFVEQVTPVAEPEPAPPAAGDRLMGRLRAFGRKP